MDIVGSLISGFIFGLSIVILLAGLGVDPFANAWLFWGFLIFAVMIGAFLLYPSGGIGVFIPIAVIAMIFGFVSLGPYSAQVREVKAQTTSPLKMVWTQISNTFGGLWLLLTNPTEYYARQQLVNVRPETPTDYPKGIEFTRMDILPASVPSGSNFMIFVVVENKGDQVAKNIEIIGSCENQYCQRTAEDPVYHKDLKPGQADILRFNFIAQGIEEGKSAQTAKVRLNVSYELTTNSSLFVETVTEQELERRVLEQRENIFRPVVAIGKVSPAQVSLNVGPQPLRAGMQSTMVVSVSNSRKDGAVVLPPGSEIRINMPSIVGTNMQCQAIKYEIKGEDLLWAQKLLSHLGIIRNDIDTVYSQVVNSETYKNMKDSVQDSSTVQKIEQLYASFKEYYDKAINYQVRGTSANDAYNSAKSKATEFIDAIKDSRLYNEIKSSIDNAYTNLKTSIQEAGTEKFEVSGCAGNVCRFSRNWTINPYDFDQVFPIYCSFSVALVSPERGSSTGLVTATLTSYRFVRSQELSIKVTPPLGIIPIGEAKDCYGQSDVHWGDYQTQLAYISAAARTFKDKTGSDETKAKALLAAVIWPTSAMGDVPQKIQSAAAKYNVPFELALKVAAQESSFAHCKDGTNNCGPDNRPEQVKGSNAGCIGIMQVCSWNMCGMTKNDVLDIDKNIECGVRILRAKYDEAKDGCRAAGIARSGCEDCNFQNYREWDAALRGYNGWACNCATCDNEYVEHVKAQDVSKYMITKPDSGTIPAIREKFGFTNDQDGLMHLTDEQMSSCSDIGTAAEIKSDASKNIQCGAKIIAGKLNSDLWSDIQNDASFREWSNCIWRREVLTTNTIALGNCRYAGLDKDGKWNENIAEKIASPKIESFDPNSLVEYKGYKMLPQTKQCAEKLDSLSSGKLHIISAYRPASDPTKITSRHQTGQAIDFVIDGMTDFGQMAILAQKTACFTWVFNEERDCPGSSGAHIHASIGIGQAALLEQDTGILQDDRY